MGETRKSLQIQMQLSDVQVYITEVNSLHVNSIEMVKQGKEINES